MLNNGQYAPLSIRSYPGRHRPPRSYLTGVLSSYSPLHGPVSGITMLNTRSGWYQFQKASHRLLARRDRKASIGFTVSSFHHVPGNFNRS